MPSINIHKDITIINKYITAHPNANQSIDKINETINQENRFAAKVQFSTFYTTTIKPRFVIPPSVPTNSEIPIDANNIEQSKDILVNDEFRYKNDNSKICDIDCWCKKTHKIVFFKCNPAIIPNLVHSCNQWYQLCDQYKPLHF